MQTLTAWGGAELVDDTTELVDTEIKAFYVREDTVVEMCAGEGSPPEHDYMDEMNLTGKTLIQGDLFFAEEGHVIQSFKLTSGSVIVYR
jgi:hypothetical protein